MPGSTERRACATAIALVACLFLPAAWAQHDPPVRVIVPAQTAQSPPAAAPRPEPAQAPPPSTPPRPDEAQAGQSQEQLPLPSRPESEEPAAVEPDPVGAEFSRLDRDGDGRITTAEHAADAKAQFDAMDADHNYHLSAGELQQAQRDGDRSIAAQIADDGEIGPMDANANGEVSVGENQNAADADFRTLDANGDGAVERAEMEQGMRPAQSPADSQAGGEGG